MLRMLERQLTHKQEHLRLFIVCDSVFIEVLVSKGRAADTIYRDLCKAFDTVLHNILVSKSETQTWWMDHLVGKELAGQPHSQCDPTWSIAPSPGVPGLRGMWIC